MIAHCADGRRPGPQTSPAAAAGARRERCPIIIGPDQEVMVSGRVTSPDYRALHVKLSSCPPTPVIGTQRCARPPPQL
jgi:hypothetical protein